MSDTSALAIPATSTENTGGRVSVVHESSTLAPVTHAEKIAFAKAVMSAESAKDNVLGQVIEVKEIIIQSTDMVNEQTGELEAVPRTVLVTPKGDAYYAFGGPVYRDARTILAIFGGTLPEPIKVKVTQGGTGNRKYLTLDVQ
jgi:hypothetical protein